MNAAQLQVSQDLEEVAMVSGASFLRMFVSVVLPLLAVSFRDGLIWVAMHAARELSAYEHLEKHTERHKRNPIDLFRAAVETWPAAIECAPGL